MGVFEVEDVEYDLLGARNGIRKILEGYVKGLADDGVGFTFGHKVHKQQVDVLKLADGNGRVLGQKLVQFYEGSSPNLAAAKYFLRNYLCYVEIPVFRTERETGIKKASFNKFLATSCVEVANSWIEGVLDETESKYGKAIESFDYLESDDSEVPILKLGRNKSGKSITRPRSYLDLNQKGIRVVPVFALKSFVDSIYKQAKQEVIRVTFIKDNGSERVLDTCLSSDVLSSLYNDSSFVGNMLESAYNGDFLGSNVIDRGYIRVPEVGASIYDGSGVRAISYTRVVEIERGVEPDMEFATVDLDGVVFEFSKYLSKLETDIVGRVANALLQEGFDMATLMSESGEHKFQIDSYQLESWADLQNRVLSTVFQRGLALFMMTNPQWFPAYTGDRKGLSSEVEIGSSVSYGILQDLDDLI